MGTGRTLALSLALTLLAAAPAGAATYASPSGSGTACTQASPCDLPTALTQAGAQSDKTAIALPGDYILTATASVPGGVTLQGTPGADLAGPGGGLAAVSAASGATVEQIVVDGFDSGGSAVELTGSALLRDAVARAANGADAVRVDTAGGGTLANVTAYASGGGAALHVAGVVLTAPAVQSSILHSDAQAVVTDIGSAAPTFDPYTDQGAVDPRFVSPPADLRLAAGSPAVDAADPNDQPAGRLDPDGLPRSYGGRVDLGAYELTPPGAGAAPVTDVTATSATFNGSVVPNARQTQYSLLLGTSLAALSSRPGATIDAGLAPVPVHQALTGLTAGTTYYVSLVAASSAGAVASPPITFATAPAPAPPLVLPPRRAATILLVGANGVRIDSRRRWRVLVQCPRVEAYACQGVLAVRSVRTLRFGRGPARRIVFGSLRFSVAPGATLRVGPTLTKAKVRLVRRLRRVTVAVSVITQGAALDDQRYFARRFTLLAPRR